MDIALEKGAKSIPELLAFKKAIDIIDNAEYTKKYGKTFLPRVYLVST